MRVLLKALIGVVAVVFAIPGLGFYIHAVVWLFMFGWRTIQ